MVDTAYEDITYSAQDGLRLNARIYGKDVNGSIPVVCLPGLSRNARDFHGLAEFLSEQTGIGRVVIFEYRGRGRSAYDRNWKNYNVATEAGDIMAGAAALGIERAAFIGTSRGGLIAMVLAGRRPALFRSVILNDIGPVIEGDGLAQIRASLTRTPRSSLFDEALAFQKSIHGLAFPALRDDDWRRMVGALYREEAGRLVPDYDPNLLKTLENIDFSKPLPVMWPQFVGLTKFPVLVIRGANSRILSQATLDEMTRLHPQLQSIAEEGQGHAPLLETGGLPEKIADFVRNSERPVRR